MDWKEALATQSKDPELKKTMAEKMRLGRVGIRRTAKGQIMPGSSGNPGGVSRLTQDFLARLRGEDADLVYEAMMDLVAERHPGVVVRCFEYIAGKPTERIEISAAPTAPPPDFSKLTLEQQLELERLMVLASPLNTIDGIVIK